MPNKTIEMWYSLKCLYRNEEKVSPSHTEEILTFRI